MDARELHPWDVEPGEARGIQERLRGEVVEEPPDGFAPGTVAGADMSIGRGEEIGFAAVVSLEAGSMEPRGEGRARGRVGFPYVPGLLSFRELPLLLEAWEELPERPDAVLFDGHGRAHPRRFGLACHGGLALDVPSVGVAKSLLVGRPGPLEGERGSTAEIRHEGELVGMAVRTRTEVSPVYVSVGHRMDLETAVDLVLSVSPRYRIPEPIRRADRRVGRLRRADAR
jgi:deoxyribonuclease V